MSDIIPFPAPEQHDGPAAGRALLYPVIGDAMSPTFRTGDAAIVDRAQGEFVGDGLYLVRDGNRALLCRLQALHGPGLAQVRLIRDNPLYGADEAALADVEIIGRVRGVIARQ